MTNPLTLIHLVSEQTMQNLLPILALRPKTVVQVRSRGDKYLAVARHIEAAVREAGIAADFKEYELPNAFSDVGETRQALGEILPQFPEAIVNVTGGTKLMSIGTILAANAFPKVAMLYCDSDRRSFIQVGKHPLPPMPSYVETARRLRLRVVMAAHGKASDAWRFNVARKADLHFGEIAFDLRWNWNSEFWHCGFSQSIRNLFRDNRGKIPSDSLSL